MPLPQRPSRLLDGLPLPVREVFQRGNILDCCCALCGSKEHSLHHCPGSTYEQRAVAASWTLRRWSLLVGMELAAFAHMTPGAYVRSRTGIVPTLSHIDIVTYVRQVTAHNDPNPFECSWRQHDHTHKSQKKTSAAPTNVSGASPQLAFVSEPILPLPTGPATPPKAAATSSNKHTSRYPQTTVASSSAPAPEQPPQPPQPHLSLKPIGSSKGSNVFKNFLGPSNRLQHSASPVSTSETHEDHPREWETPDRPPSKQRLVNPQRVASNITRSFPADSTSFVVPIIAVKQRPPTLPPSTNSPFLRTFLPAASPPSAEVAIAQISCVGSDAVAKGTISKQQFELAVAILKEISPTQRCFLWNSSAATLAYFKNPITFRERPSNADTLVSANTSSLASACSTAASSSCSSSSSTSTILDLPSSSVAPQPTSSSLLASPCPKPSQHQRTVPTSAVYCQMDYNARRKVWLEAPQSQLQILWDSLPPKAKTSSQQWAERVGITVSVPAETSSTVSSTIIDSTTAAVDVDNEVL